MLAFIVQGRRLVAKKKPLPKLRKGWALIRVRLAGICNTDVEILRGYHNFRGTAGHEFVGQVAEVRGVSNATKKDGWDSAFAEKLTFLVRRMASSRCAIFAAAA